MLHSIFHQFEAGVADAIASLKWVFMYRHLELGGSKLPLHQVAV